VNPSAANHLSQILPPAILYSWPLKLEQGKCFYIRAKRRFQNSVHSFYNLRVQPSRNKGKGDKKTIAKNAISLFRSLGGQLRRPGAQCNKNTPRSSVFRSSFFVSVQKRTAAVRAKKISRDCEFPPFSRTLNRRRE
jgi:hypothetical protein